MSETSDEGDEIKSLIKKNDITSEYIFSIFLEMQLCDVIKIGQSKLQSLLKALMKELSAYENMTNSSFVSNALNNVTVHMSEEVRDIVRNKYPELDLKGMNPFHKFPTV